MTTQSKSNIPPTRQRGMYLTSTGNGSEAVWTPLGSAAGGGGASVPNGTATGQMLAWNGTAWVVTTAPSTNGQVLVWNSSTSTWVPGTPTSNATQIQGNSVASTTPGTGAILQYYGGWQVANPAPTTNGQILVWNSSANAWQASSTVNATQLQGYAIDSSIPTNGSLLMYTTTGTPKWTEVSAPSAAGQLLYWNGVAWVQTATPGTGQVLYWNGSAWTGVTALTSSTSAGGDLTGTYPNPTINKLQGYTLAVSGANAPVSGSLLGYSTTTNQWTTFASPSGVGQMLYWNGYGWVQTTTPPTVTGQYYAWNATSSTWTLTSGGGGSGLTNNDAGGVYASTGGAQPQNTQNIVGGMTVNFGPKGAMTFYGSGIYANTVGFYHIIGQIAITPSVAFSQLQAQILVGGTQVATVNAGPIASGLQASVQVSCIANVISTGTTIQLAWYYTNTSGSTTHALTTGGDYTWLSASLVSE